MPRFRDELRSLRDDARRWAARQATGELVTPRAGLYLLRQRTRTRLEATLSRPMLFVVLEGRKQMRFAGRSFTLGAGECALVSHDLPIASRVLEAPYLVLLLEIDVSVVRSLYEDAGELALAPAPRALEIQRADARLLDALGRYLVLSESPVDARVLGPLLLKEIHYRLLAAPIGHMLRSLLRHDSHASAVARAIALLQRDFRAPMAVEKLARAVGMSVSSFHKHFKAVTASSPLQYQKSLRLLAARQLLLSGADSVTTTAFEVGYESPTQFAREYARKFGHPPRLDLARGRGASARAQPPAPPQIA